MGSRAVLFQRLDLRNPFFQDHAHIFSLLSCMDDDKSRLLSKYCQMSSSIRSDSFLVVPSIRLMIMLDALLKEELVDVMDGAAEEEEADEEVSKVTATIVPPATDSTIRKPYLKFGVSAILGLGDDDREDESSHRRYNNNNIHQIRQLHPKGEGILTTHPPHPHHHLHPAAAAYLQSYFHQHPPPLPHSLIHHTHHPTSIKQFNSRTQFLYFYFKLGREL